jgi:hypothetical protein
LDAALIRVGARLLTDGAADVRPEELTDAWRSARTGPPKQLDRITAAHLAADRAGTDLHALAGRALRGSGSETPSGQVPARERSACRELHPSGAQLRQLTCDPTGST